MEKESSGQRPVRANSTGGQGSSRAVAPSDDDDVHKSAPQDILSTRTHHVNLRRINIIQNENMS
jgi:hypothetical protein